MPRIVDHDERRKDIAEAAWAVIARQGIEAASLQAIAAQLNSSTGTVSHYFQSKEAVIHFTFRLKTNEIFREIEAETRCLNPGLDRLRLALKKMTPVLSGASIAGGAAALSYWGLAVSQPSLAELHRECSTEWRTMLRCFIQEAIDRGEAPTALNLDLEVSILVAIADGLLVGAALEPRLVSAKMAQRMLDTVIYGRLGGAPSRPMGTT